MENSEWYNHGDGKGCGSARARVYVYIYWGYAVAQLVEALRYKTERHGFDTRWCHLNFSLT